MKRLGFGTMRLPLTDKNDAKSIDYGLFCDMADCFIERGFTYFDTAYPYHDEMSETAVKKCVVERYPRDRFVLADKMPVYKVKQKSDFGDIFNEQLKRCNVEYFDYYLLHNIGKERYETIMSNGGFDFLSKLKKNGLAGKIGFSFHDDADFLDRVLSENPDVDFVQLQINYLDWDSHLIQSRLCYETALKHKKKIVVMEPVKGGMLAELPKDALRLLLEEGMDCSPASYAIRYAASLDNVFMVLSGMGSLEQILDNTTYMSDFKPLEDSEKKVLSGITDILNGTIEIPCTSCRYCTEVCPKKINIPGYFALYNAYKITGKKTNMYFQRISAGHGAAADCIKCGKCEKNCPQHIAVREWLEKFAALYEADK